ncbi:MAG: hypothetical protein IT326_05895, partial [Anaerolineae bacterium]|nr:hypothetical protein [Anaerolineae bacterium]
MAFFPLIWLVLAVIAVGAIFVLQPNRHVTWLILISLIILAAGWASLPNNPGIVLDINGDGINELDKPIEIRQGLDLAGGLKVLLEADLPAEAAVDAASMKEVRQIVENRVDSLGA